MPSVEAIAMGKEMECIDWPARSTFQHSPRREREIPSQKKEGWEVWEETKTGCHSPLS